MPTKITQNKDKTKRVMHPNSLANLKPIKPGECLNPGGRPKYKPITDRIKAILDMEYLANGKTVAQCIAEGVIEDILDPAGNLKHGFNTPLLKELLDRVEGRVVEPHAILGDIEITIIHKDKGGEDVRAIVVSLVHSN